jgi:hypothetical protein
MFVCSKVVSDSNVTLFFGHRYWAVVDLPCQIQRHSSTSKCQFTSDITCLIRCVSSCFLFPYLANEAVVTIIYSGPSNFERFDVRTTLNWNKEFEENPVLKLKQNLESRRKNHVVAFLCLVARAVARLVLSDGFSEHLANSAFYLFLLVIFILSLIIPINNGTKESY